MSKAADPFPRYGKMGYPAQKMSLREGMMRKGVKAGSCLREKTGHFYEQKTRGYVSETGWDLQKVDLGIALYHFACGAASQGLTAELTVADPGLAAPEQTDYIASFLLKDPA